MSQKLSGFRDGRSLSLSEMPSCLAQPLASASAVLR